jgi:hypothetical protein
MIEIDAVLFVVRTAVDQNLGFNFLKQINFTFNSFAADNKRGYGPCAADEVLMGSAVDEPVTSPGRRPNC